MDYVYSDFLQRYLYNRVLNAEDFQTHPSVILCIQNLGLGALRRGKLENQCEVKILHLKNKSSPLKYFFNIYLFVVPGLSCGRRTP